MKIALFGKMRSGKDEIGRFLIEHYDFKRYAFGDEIGRLIRIYFPEAFDEGKPRKHYQHIGQQFRVLDEDVWVKKLLEGVKDDEDWAELRGDDFNVIVTDGRQLNEAERLREAGFTIVKVECDEDIRIERIKASGDAFVPEQLNHETEMQVDLIVPDVVIKNNGTLADLYRQVLPLVEGMVTPIEE